MPAEENGPNQTRDHSFDELARGLANRSLSRGDALKRVGAAIVGGLLASIPGAALAQGGRSSGAQGCPYPGQVKVKGQCQCPSGQEICGGSCVSTSCPGDQTFNPATCACECPPKTCSGEQILDQSTCTCGCPPGNTLCWDGRCIPNCTGGQIFDQNACQCVDPIYCATVIDGQSVTQLCEANGYKCCDAEGGPFCCPPENLEGQCGWAAYCFNPYNVHPIA